MELFSIANAALETERLLIRPYRESDLPAFFAYASEPDVGDMAGHPRHESPEDSKRVLNIYLNEKPTFAIFTKSEKKLIGDIGLRVPWTKDDENYKHLRAKEIGFSLSPAYRGKGLMQEALHAVIRYCFDAGLEALCARHYAENIASQRVMEKMGFMFTKKAKRFTEETQKNVFELFYILTNEGLTK